MRAARARPAGESGIRARGVLVVRGGREVLRDGALDVARGRVAVLVAPSGTGKSSLLRCCTRLLEPRAGAVTLDGVPVAELDPRALRRRVGLVAQVPVMLPGTVAENLAHGLDALPGDRRRTALARAGLPEAFAARTARELSGGERARVALARALVREPEVLLLDEPTSALDAALVARLARTLRELADDGLAVCAATHDRAFADALGVPAVDLHGAPA